MKASLASSLGFHLHPQHYQHKIKQREHAIVVQALFHGRSSGHINPLTIFDLRRMSK